MIFKFEYKGETINLDPIPTTVGAVTTAVTQSSVGVGTTMVVGNLVTTGTPPSALWLMLQQLQMVNIILIIDYFTPEDLNYYLEGTSFAMFNFNFIPVTEFPGIKIPLYSFEFPQLIVKLEFFGFESRSTLYNNISLILMIGLVG